jgi:hypothetical protein
MILALPVHDRVGKWNKVLRYKVTCAAILMTGRRWLACTVGSAGGK